MSLISHTHLSLVLAFTLLSPLFVNSHICSEEFSTEINKIFTTRSCRQKTLGAEFGWTFNKKSRRLDIAFGARLHSENGWIAWGLNPHEPRMIETRALIGMKHKNGSLEWHKYNITKATKMRGCALLPSEDIGINVSNFSFVYLEKIEYYVILATIFLPSEYNSSRTNVVWQIGEAVNEREPRMHPKSLNNFDSAQTIDFVSDSIISYTSHQRRYLRFVSLFFLLVIKFT